MKTLSSFISFIATFDEPISHYHGFRQCVIGKFGESIGHDPQLLEELLEKLVTDVGNELVTDFPSIKMGASLADVLDLDFTEHQQYTHASVQAFKLLRDLNDADFMNRVAPTMDRLRAYIADTYPLIPTT